MTKSTYTQQLQTTNPNILNAILLTEENKKKKNTCLDLEVAVKSKHVDFYYLSTLPITAIKDEETEKDSFPIISTICKAKGCNNQCPKTNGPKLYEVILKDKPILMVENKTFNDILKNKYEIQKKDDVIIQKVKVQKPKEIIVNKQEEQIIEVELIFKQSFHVLNNIKRFKKETTLEFRKKKHDKLQQFYLNRKNIKQQKKEQIEIKHIHKQKNNNVNKNSNDKIKKNNQLTNLELLKNQKTIKPSQLQILENVKDEFINPHKINACCITLHNKNNKQHKTTICFECRKLSIIFNTKYQQILEHNEALYRKVKLEEENRMEDICTCYSTGSIRIGSKKCLKHGNYENSCSILRFSNNLAKCYKSKYSNEIQQGDEPRGFGNEKGHVKECCKCHWLSDECDPNICCIHATDLDLNRILELNPPVKTLNWELSNPMYIIELQTNFNCYPSNKENQLKQFNHYINTSFKEFIIITYRKEIYIMNPENLKVWKYGTVKGVLSMRYKIHPSEILMKLSEFIEFYEIDQNEITEEMITDFILSLTIYTRCRENLDINKPIYVLIHNENFNTLNHCSNKPFEQLTVQSRNITKEEFLILEKKTKFYSGPELEITPKDNDIKFSNEKDARRMTLMGIDMSDDNIKESVKLWTFIKIFLSLLKYKIVRFFKYTILKQEKYKKQVLKDLTNKVVKLDLGSEEINDDKTKNPEYIIDEYKDYITHAKQTWLNKDNMNYDAIPTKYADMFMYMLKTTKASLYVTPRSSITKLKKSDSPIVYRYMLFLILIDIDREIGVYLSDFKGNFGDFYHVSYFMKQYFHPSGNCLEDLKNKYKDKKNKNPIVYYYVNDKFPFLNHVSDNKKTFYIKSKHLKKIKLNEVDSLNKKFYAEDFTLNSMEELNNLHIGANDIEDGYCYLPMLCTRENMKKIYMEKYPKTMGLLDFTKDILEIYHYRCECMVFNLQKKNLHMLTVEPVRKGKKMRMAYTLDEITPAPTVVDNNTILQEGVNYRLNFTGSPIQEIGQLFLKKVFDYYKAKPEKKIIKKQCDKPQDLLTKLIKKISSDKLTNCYLLTTESFMVPNIIVKSMKFIISKTKYDKHVINISLSDLNDLLQTVLNDTKEIANDFNIDKLELINNIKIGIREASELSHALITDINNVVEDNIEVQQMISNHNRNLFNKTIEAIKKKTHYCHSSLNEESKNLLTTTFPEVDIIPADKVFHPHGLHANVREILENQVYKSFGAHMAIYDLGGNYFRHIKNNRVNVHSCLRVEDVIEHTRMIDIDLNLVSDFFKKQKKIAKAFNTNEQPQTIDYELTASIVDSLKSGKTPYFCNNSVLKCNVQHKNPIAVGMSIDSIFDVDPFDILKWHQKNKIVKSTHCFTFDYQMMYKNEGTLLNNEGFWKIDDNKKLTMTLVGSDDVYVNDFSNVLKFLTNKMYVGNKSGIYFKVDGVLLTHMKIHIYSVPENFIITNAILKSVWLTSTTDEVLMKLPIIKNKRILNLFHKVGMPNFNKMFNNEGELNRNEDGSLEVNTLLPKLDDLASYFLAPYTEANVSAASKDTKANDYDKNDFHSPDEIFNFEVILVNIKLLNLMVTRLIWANSNKKSLLWADLIEYVRTLKFSLFVTSTTQINRFKEDPYLMYKHALLAMYVHYNMYEKLGPILTNITATRDPSFLNQTKNAFLNHLSEFLSLIEPMNVEVIREYLNKYSDTETFTIKKMFEDSMDTFQHLNVISMHKQNNLIILTNVEKDNSNNLKITTNTKLMLTKDCKPLADFKDNVEGASLKCNHNSTCTHIPCDSSLHLFFGAMNGIKENCECCGVMSYTIKERCYRCTYYQNCSKAWNSKCKAKHEFIQEHCCGDDVNKCDCIRDVLCMCCLNYSTTSYCRLCRRFCKIEEKELTNEKLISKENKRRKTKDMNEIDSDESSFEYDSEHEGTIPTSLNSERISKKKEKTPLENETQVNDFINPDSSIHETWDDPKEETSNSQNETDLNTSQSKITNESKPIDSNNFPKPIISSTTSNINRPSTGQPTNQTSSSIEETKTDNKFNEFLDQVNRPPFKPEEARKSKPIIVKHTTEMPEKFDFSHLELSKEETLNSYITEFKKHFENIAYINLIHGSFNVYVGPQDDKKLLVVTKHMFNFIYFNNSQDYITFTGITKLIKINLVNNSKGEKLRVSLTNLNFLSLEKIYLNDICYDGLKNYEYNVDFKTAILFLKKCITMLQLIKNKPRNYKETLTLTIYDSYFNYFNDNIQILTKFQRKYKNKTKPVSLQDEQINNRLIETLSVIHNEEQSLIKKILNTPLICNLVDKSIQLTEQTNIPKNRIFNVIKNAVITRIEDVPGNGLCGWYALKKTFNLLDEHLNLLREITGKLEFYDSIDLATFCIHMNLNVIILSHTGLMAYRANESNLFGAILHTKLYCDQLHWQSANVKVLSTHDHVFGLNLDLENSSLVKVLDYKNNITYNKGEMIRNLDHYLLVNLKDIDLIEEVHAITGSKLGKLVKTQISNKIYENHSIKNDECLHYITKVFKDDEKLSKYMIPLGKPNNYLLYAPCSFGKTLKSFECFEGSYILVIPLRKSCIDAYNQFIKNKPHLKIGLQQHGNFTSNKPVKSFNNVDILIITVDSLLIYINKNLNLLNFTGIMFDEVHEKTPNYLSVISQVNYHVRNRHNYKIIYSTATFNENYIVSTSRYPIEINDYVVHEDIPVEKEGFTIVLVAGENHATDIKRNYFNDYEWEKEIFYVDSQRLLKEPTIFDKEDGVFLCTNAISVGVTIPNLDTLIDLGDRLEVYCNPDVLPENYPYWHTSVRYHTLSEKIQTQRRLGRTKPGKYYGLAFFKDKIINSTEYFELSKIRNLMVPKFVQEQYQGYIKNLKNFPNEQKVFEHITKFLKDQNNTQHSKFSSWNKLDEEGIHLRCQTYMEKVINNFKWVTNVNSNNIKAVLPDNTQLSFNTIWDQLFGSITNNMSASRTEYNNKIFEQVKDDKEILKCLNKPFKATATNVISNSILTKCNKCGKPCFKLFDLECSECDHSSIVTHQISSKEEIKRNINTCQLTFNFIQENYEIINKVNDKVFNFTSGSNLEINKAYVSHMIRTIYHHMYILNKVSSLNLSSNERHEDVEILDFSKFNFSLNKLASSCKMRSGDRYSILLNTKQYELYTWPNTPTQDLYSIVKVIILKEKTSFYINILLSLLDEPRYFNLIDSKIKNAQYINGTAGSGKSSSIKDDYKNVVICDPYQGNLKLKQRLKKTQVYTSAKFIAHGVKKEWHHVYIDEANTINILSLRLLIPDNISGLTIMGDKHQFPAREYSCVHTTDATLNNNILEEKPYTPGLDETKRYNKTIAQINNAMGIKCKSNIEGEVKYYIHDQKEENLPSYITSIIPKGTMILTQNKGSIYQNFVLNIPFEYKVESVISSEGNDWDNVCVVLQFADKNLMDRRFIYTALTRAKKNVYIFIHKQIQHYDLIKIITKFGFDDKAGANESYNEYINMLNETVKSKKLIENNILNIDYYSPIVVRIDQEEKNDSNNDYLSNYREFWDQVEPLIDEDLIDKNVTLEISGYNKVKLIMHKVNNNFKSILEKIIKFFEEIYNKVKSSIYKMFKQQDLTEEMIEDGFEPVELFSSTSGGLFTFKDLCEKMRDVMSLWINKIKNIYLIIKTLISTKYKKVKEVLNTYFGKIFYKHYLKALLPLYHEMLITLGKEEFTDPKVADYKYSKDKIIGLLNLDDFFKIFFKQFLLIFEFYDEFEIETYKENLLKNFSLYLKNKNPLVGNMWTHMIIYGLINRKFEAEHEFFIYKLGGDNLLLSYMEIIKQYDVFAGNEIPNLTKDVVYLANWTKRIKHLNNLTIFITLNTFIFDVEENNIVNVRARHVGPTALFTVDKKHKDDTSIDFWFTNNCVMQDYSGEGQFLTEELHMHYISWANLLQIQRNAVPIAQHPSKRYSQLLLTVDVGGDIIINYEKIFKTIKEAAVKISDKIKLFFNKTWNFIMRIIKLFHKSEELPTINIRDIKLPIGHELGKDRIELLKIIKSYSEKFDVSTPYTAKTVYLKYVLNYELDLIVSHPFFIKMEKKYHNLEHYSHYLLCKQTLINIRNVKTIETYKSYMLYLHKCVMNINFEYLDKNFIKHKDNAGGISGYNGYLKKLIKKHKENKKIDLYIFKRKVEEIYDKFKNQVTIIVKAYDWTKLKIILLFIKEKILNWSYKCKQYFNAETIENIEMEEITKTNETQIENNNIIVNINGTKNPFMNFEKENNELDANAAVKLIDLSTSDSGGLINIKRIFVMMNKNIKRIWSFIMRKFKNYIFGKSTEDQQIEQNIIQDLESRLELKQQEINQLTNQIMNSLNKEPQNIKETLILDSTYSATEAENANINEYAHLFKNLEERERIWVEETPLTMEEAYEQLLEASKKSEVKNLLFELTVTGNKNTYEVTMSGGTGLAHIDSTTKIMNVNVSCSNVFGYKIVSVRRGHEVSVYSDAPDKLLNKITSAIRKINIQLAKEKQENAKSEIKENDQAKITDAGNGLQPNMSIKNYFTLLIGLIKTWIFEKLERIAFKMRGVFTSKLFISGETHSTEFAIRTIFEFSKIHNLTIVNYVFGKCIIIEEKNIHFTNILKYDYREEPNNLNLMINNKDNRIIKTECILYVLFSKICKVETVNITDQKNNVDIPKNENRKENKTNEKAKSNKENDEKNDKFNNLQSELDELNNKMDQIIKGIRQEQKPSVKNRISSLFNFQSSNTDKTVNKIPNFKDHGPFYLEANTNVNGEIKTYIIPLHKKNYTIINGKSGTGKSLLFKRISNGHFNSSLNIQKSIYVSQFLNNRTINIENFKRLIQKESSVYDYNRFNEALKLLAANFPETTDLSGGQTIIIIVCLAISCKLNLLLILDEADSHVTSEQRAEIEHYLTQQDNVQTILISHFQNGIPMDQCEVTTNRDENRYKGFTSIKNCYCTQYKQWKEVLNSVKNKNNIEFDIIFQENVIQEMLALNEVNFMKSKKTSKRSTNICNFVYESSHPKFKILNTAIEKLYKLQNENKEDEEDASKYFTVEEMNDLDELFENNHLQQMLLKVTELPTYEANIKTSYTEFNKYCMELINKIHKHLTPLCDIQGSCEIPRCNNCSANLSFYLSSSLNKSLILKSSIKQFIETNFIQVETNNTHQSIVACVPKIEGVVEGKSGVGKSTLLHKIANSKLNIMKFSQQLENNDSKIKDIIKYVELIYFMRFKKLIDLTQLIPNKLLTPVYFSRLSGGQQFMFLFFLSSLELNDLTVLDENLRSLGREVHDNFIQHIPPRTTVITHYPRKFNTISLESIKIPYKQESGLEKYCMVIFDKYYRNYIEKVHNSLKDNLYFEIYVNIKCLSLKPSSIIDLKGQKNRTTPIVCTIYNRDNSGEIKEIQMVAPCSMEHYVEIICNENKIPLNEIANPLIYNMNSKDFKLLEWKQQVLYSYLDKLDLSIVIRQIMNYSNGDVANLNEFHKQLFAGLETNIMLISNGTEVLKNKDFIKFQPKYIWIRPNNNKWLVVTNSNDNLILYTENVITHLNKINAPENVSRVVQLMNLMYGSISDIGGGFKDIMSHWIKNDIPIKKINVNSKTIENVTEYIQTDGNNLINTIINDNLNDETMEGIIESYKDSFNSQNKLADVLNKTINEFRINFVVSKSMHSNLEQKASFINSSFSNGIDINKTNFDLYDYLGMLANENNTMEEKHSLMLRVGEINKIELRKSRFQFTCSVENKENTINYNISHFEKMNETIFFMDKIINEAQLSIRGSLNKNLNFNYFNTSVLEDYMFFNETDLTYDNDIELDKNLPPYKIFEGPNIIKEREVGWLNDYPSFSRPAPLGQSNTIRKAINQKINQDLKLRKGYIPHNEQYEYFKKAFFIDHVDIYLDLFQQNPVSMNKDLISWWISNRKGGSILNEVEEILFGMNHKYRMNLVKMIEKPENITKGDIYSSMSQMTNRIVLWNPYGYNLMFAPIYSMIKYRFKKILKPEVIYAEDMNLMELNEKLNQRKFTPNFKFFESDLSKQDRQTDSHSLEFEYLMYERLGIDKSINNFYKSQHYKTKLGHHTFKTTTKPKRHTGQTTVGFGNVINNMRTYSKLFSQIKFDFICILGDDLLSSLQYNFDVDLLAKETEHFHNMKSTYTIKEDQGIFCQFIVSRTEFNYIILPNLVRIQDRLRCLYRVTDKVVSEVIIPKIMSYCWLIGKNAATESIANLYGFPCPSNTLCSESLLIQINAKFHNESEYSMAIIYDNLVRVMANFQLFTHKFKIISTNEMNKRSGKS